MIAVIDYGVGNMFSIQSSFAKIGANAVVTSDKKIIEQADRIMLPGVGAYADAAKKLKESGLGELIIQEVKKGKPTMGICLGMQLLFERSYEYGEHEGLGILKGEVIPMKGYIDKGLKVPHIGWNSLEIERENRLLRGCRQGDFVYFVHSYFVANCRESRIASVEYGKALTAAVEQENVFGCQFHPEKSGEVGLRILHNFCNVKGR